MGAALEVVGSVPGALRATMETVGLGVHFDDFPGKRMSRLAPLNCCARSECHQRLAVPIDACL